MTRYPRAQALTRDCYEYEKVDLAKITLGAVPQPPHRLLLHGAAPFLPALVWATMITIATWPLMLMVQRVLWGKRSLAALFMTLVLLLMFVIPLFMTLANVAEKAPMLIELGTNISQSPPPELLWLQQIPLVGDKLYGFWQQILASGGQVLLPSWLPTLARPPAGSPLRRVIWGCCSFTSC